VEELETIHLATKTFAENALSSAKSENQEFHLRLAELKALLFKEQLTFQSAQVSLFEKFSEAVRVML